jgi:hypothetical protein
MKKILFILFAFIGSFSFSQDYDFQALCLACAEAEGYYCGDDPTNWTQYSPDGCVQTSWINDAWLDCVDGSDEGNDVVPTTIAECEPEAVPCDTVYVEIPIIEIEYIDCASGLPCNSGMGEVIDKSKTNNKMYTLWGYEIIRPEGVYIQNGKIKYELN